MASPGAAGSIRLDKLLWFLRFARSRSVAQAMVEAGHIRLDGRRVTRSSCAVHAGATLVLPVGERIEVIRLLSLPLRRGPIGYRRRWKCFARKGGRSSYSMRVIRNCRLALTHRLHAA